MYHDVLRSQSASNQFSVLDLRGGSKQFKGSAVGSGTIFYVVFLPSDSENHLQQRLEDKEWKQFATPSQITISAPLGVVIQRLRTTLNLRNKYFSGRKTHSNYNYCNPTISTTSRAYLWATSPSPIMHKHSPTVKLQEEMKQLRQNIVIFWGYVLDS